MRARLNGCSRAAPVDRKKQRRSGSDETGALADLIEEARANTEQWLTTFLGAAGFDTVEITWQDSPA